MPITSLTFFTTQKAELAQFLPHQKVRSKYYADLMVGAVQLFVSANRWSIIYAVLLDDFVYYLYHRFFSHGVASNSALAQFGRNVHTPHHSVNELDFLRGNLSSFLDTAVLARPLRVYCCSISNNESCLKSWKKEFSGRSDFLLKGGKDEGL